jgi:SulP family sulfate permease
MDAVRLGDHSPGPTPPLFTPKLFTVLREGYGLTDLRADALAGLTVAVVALPLSMAIAIASGVAPERGLFTAVIGGFLVSALGGSRFQIGGPAGAFIVIVAGIVERHGYQGLVVATLLAGLAMIVAGILRLGSIIRYVPYPVLVGFTSGIAVIIFASQIHELLGLDMASEPAALLPKLAAIAAAFGSIKASTALLSLLTIGIILALRHYRPHWPGLLIAVAFAAGLAYLAHWPVVTIGSRFGGVPRTLPWPELPQLSLTAIQVALPDALSIFLLGSIESLLSASVADGMTGRRHRSNGELLAQGVGNIGSALFGGFASTGLIARTATNIRAGARSPIAGMLHSAFVLLVMLVGAPLASYIPLAALGGVLAVVAWTMAERDVFIRLLQGSRGDAGVLLTTFLLTIFADLTLAIGAGVALAGLLVLRDMAEAVDVRPHGEDDSNGESAAADAKAGILVWRISGPLFFGATSAAANALERIGSSPRALILDLSGVSIADISAARMLAAFAGHLTKSGAMIYLCGATVPVRRALLNVGLREPTVHYRSDIASARKEAQDASSESGPRLASPMATN